ncbi:hypothetical protein [Lysinibacillus agricola]|uniref:hypothetical protein n=1 Tax=Lysinibacillus agricola TaxID=2590012 RepID=UPI003C27CC80
MNDRQRLSDNIRKLVRFKDYSSNKLTRETLKMFTLSKQRTWILLFLFLILFLITKFILFDEKTAVEIIANLTNILNSILTPMFAVIITGYAIFQAIANESTLLVLLKVTHKDDESKFAVYNKYFYGIAILYLSLTIINMVMQFIFSNLSKEWFLPIFNNHYNESIAAVLISLYLVVIINALIELKSFTYNLFQVFVTSTASTGINALEKMSDEKKE